MNAKREAAKRFLQEYNSRVFLVKYAKSELEWVQNAERMCDSVSVAKMMGLKTTDPKARFAEYKNQVIQDIKRLTVPKDFLQKIQDEKLVAVLRYRYIDRLKWEDIAYEMGYCRRTIHQLHNIALDAVADILFADKSAA